MEYIEADTQIKQESGASSTKVWVWNDLYFHLVIC